MRFGYDAKRAFHNNSGLGNYSRDIIRIMSRQFPDNEYILFNPKKAASGRVIEGDNIKVIYPEGIYWKLFSGIWRQIGIAKEVKKNSIDLYHGLSGEIPHGLNRKQTKTIVTIHDLIPQRFPELYKPLDRKIYWSKLSYAAKNADRIIAISEQTKTDIIHFLKPDESKIRVHYQGCHAAFKERYSPAEIENVKVSYSLSDNFILNVGTIEKRKNALSILKAIKDLPYHLVLIGKPTSYANQMKRFIRDNNMQDRIRFLEGVKVKELAMLYQAASLFCYPSVFEGFGIPIIESLYSRTAVITSTGGCFAEAGGPDSVYVDPTNIQDLKMAITRLMTDETERKSREQSGYRFVQKFNDEHVGNKLMDIYQELL